jgi:hypothetical protein
MRALLLALVIGMAGSANARLTEIGVQKVEPFADGASFGEAGAYVRVSGVARGELDPADPRNRGIVNLERAPRNARGNVDYEVEWFMLRPADAGRGNGRLIYDVTNRGRKFLLHWVLDAPAQAVSAVNDPRTEKDAGNSLLFRRGYSMLWSGWDPDAPKSNNGMAMTVPVVPGVVRVIRDELVSGTRGPQRDTFRLSYEAADLDQSKARLTSRRNERDARVEIPANGWAWVNSREIRLTAGQPLPGSLYEFHYPAKDPKVLGVGFAAVRDLVSFLRYETGDTQFAPNPAGRSLVYALATGISQSGRYLRDFVHQGYNRDETQRKVFDGVLSHIAGVGGVFLNAEFGQPARTNTQHEDHYYPENTFPFSTAASRDPVSKRRAALLRGDGFDPLWMDVNTSTEYWQKAASLLHTDPQGRADLELPANARVYLVAGTQHAGRVGLKPDLGPCSNPRNPHNPAPALRALLIALDEWATRGRLPPPSSVPTLKAGTLVTADRIGFPPIPGMAVAKAVNEVALFGDWVHPKEAAPSPYKPLVAKVDRDGNEVAGIRLPDIAVPLGTYTGWNLYKAPFTEGELCDRDGTYMEFARTAAERTAKGDPRPSLEERYGSHGRYVAAVERAARDLVKQRLLLEEDAERYVKAAQARGW